MHLKTPQFVIGTTFVPQIYIISETKVMCPSVAFQVMQNVRRAGSFPEEEEYISNVIPTYYLQSLAEIAIFYKETDLSEWKRVFFEGIRN